MPAFPSRGGGDTEGWWFESCGCAPVHSWSTARAHTGLTTGLWSTRLTVAQKTGSTDNNLAGTEKVPLMPSDQQVQLV